MIRFITRARLDRLTADAEQARERAALLQRQADTAFTAHLQRVTELTGRAEQAEQAQAGADRAADKLRADLRALTTELAQRTESVAALSGARSGQAFMVLLLRYGQPHSIHPDRESAHACAVRQGAAVDGWRPYDGPVPAGEPWAWATVVFIYDAERDAFDNPRVAGLPVAGGAG